MAERRPWRTRLAAGGAGLVINVGLLALLTLERRTPPMAEPPAVVVALEPRASPPERRRSPPARRAGAPASTPPLEAPPDVDPLVLPAAPPGNDLSSTVEPRWRVGGGEYLDPETARRARRAWEAAEDRRYKRACLGQSDEHMTPEEKDACWDAWGGNAPLSGSGGSRPGRRYPGPATTSPRPGSG
ncbi:hypothetical protein [Caulobacter sp. UNC358MFTsu5.1]|uniref:hypothetical protein n=1 Tax=Caulobacter sp. UNC358MFTsu5.1 TaxID=1449049 RepID=UPI000B12FA2A|nr:hypothetical protein [Caulobacter sp. UNC358MFTsu5.1]